MALCRLVGPVFVALRDVLTDGRPGAEEREDARAGGGGGGGGLGVLSVALTRGLLPLCQRKIKQRKHDDLDRRHIRGGALSKSEMAAK